MSNFTATYRNDTHERTYVLTHDANYGGWMWTRQGESTHSLPFEEHRFAVRDARRDFEEEHGPIKVKAILFKESGKYYTEGLWTIPEKTLGPFDMVNSPDFRRIGNGAVLIESQEPWGFPHLIV